MLNLFLNISLVSIKWSKSFGIKITIIISVNFILDIPVSSVLEGITVVVNSTRDRQPFKHLFITNIKVRLWASVSDIFDIRIILAYALVTEITIKLLLLGHNNALMIWGVS